MRRRLVTAALVVALCSVPTPADDAGFAVPPDAVRIDAGELSEPTLSERLAGLLPADDTGPDGALGTAMRRLGAVLRGAEQRRDAAKSRLLSVNRGAYFRGLLIVWLPVSFLLPTLAKRRPYDGPDVEGAHFIRRRLGNDVGEQYSADASLYKFEAHYGPLLSRLDAYFHLMGVDSAPCRRKLVCHASHEPEAFEPLSNLFRRLFERAEKRPPEPLNYHPALKLFRSYVWADKKGSRYSTAAQCDDEYRDCPLPASALIRTDALAFWQDLSKRFAIQLQDE